MFYGVIARMYMSYGDCFEAVKGTKAYWSTAGTRRLSGGFGHSCQNGQLCTNIQHCTAGSVQVPADTPLQIGIRLTVLTRNVPPMYDPCSQATHVAKPVLANGGLRGHGVCSR